MHHKASVSTSQRTKRGQRSGQHQKRHAMPKRVQHVQSSRSIHVRSTQSASFTSTGSSQHDLQTSSARHIHTLKSSVDQGMFYLQYILFPMLLLNDYYYT